MKRMVRLRSRLLSRRCSACWMVCFTVFAAPSQAKEETAEIPASQREALIKSMDDEDFPTRETASKELLKWATQHPKKSSVELCRIYHEASSPEVKARLHFIIKTLYFKRAKPILGISFKEKVITLKNGRTVKSMLVTRVRKGKSAHKGGILAGDIIIKMGGELPKPKDVMFIAKSDLSSLPVGEKVPFHIRRDGELLVLQIRIQGRLIIDTAKEKTKENEEMFDRWLEKQRVSS